MAKFERNMDNLMQFNDRIWEYLSGIPLNQWSWIAFETHAKSQMIINNMCEEFNSKFVLVKGKPIILMLKEIRLYIMKKTID